jgi:hypothetical protein
MTRHQPHSRRNLLLGCAVFATAVIVAVLRVTTLSEAFGVRLSMPWAMNDFKSAIYCPVALFLQGGNPYDRAQFLQFCPVRDVFPLYLPATLIVHAPLGVLPIDAATLLYFCLTAALSLTIVFLALRLTGGEASLASVLFGAGLLLLSRPGQWNWLLGQPGLELAIASYVAVYWARRAPLVSGLALAVSMYKPTFGVPLALLMLVRGDVRATAAGLAFATVLNMVPLSLLLQRAGGLEAFTTDLLRSQRVWQGVVDPSTQVYGVDAPSLLSRLLGRRLSLGTYLSVSLGVLGVAAAALRSIRRMEDPKSAHLSATLVCLAVLLSVHHHAYDLVLLVGPVIHVITSSMPSGVLTSRVRAGLLSLYALLGANYVTTQSVLHRLEPQSLLWVGLASINSALLLVTFLTYIGLVITRARAVASTPAGAPG